MLVRGSRALLFGLQGGVVGLALGRDQLHGIGEDIGKIEGAWWHAVLARAALGRLHGRDEGGIIARRRTKDTCVVHVV